MRYMCWHLDALPKFKQATSSASRRCGGLLGCAGVLRESVHAWAAAVQGSGAATAEQLAAAIEVSLSQFAPDLANQAPSQDQQASD